jgi:hypothetical protein
MDGEGGWKESSKNSEKQKTIHTHKDLLFEVEECSYQPPPLGYVMEFLHEICQLTAVALRILGLTIRQGGKR